MARTMKPLHTVRVGDVLDMAIPAHLDVGQDAIVTRVWRGLGLDGTNVRVYVRFATSRTSAGIKASYGRVFESNGHAQVVVHIHSAFGEIETECPETEY